jgi:hypothetical protein
LAGRSSPPSACAAGTPDCSGWALDWNGPAIGFYRSIGAEPMNEWTVYRITGRTLTALASDR